MIETHDEEEHQLKRSPASEQAQQCLGLVIDI